MSPLLRLMRFFTDLSRGLVRVLVRRMGNNFYMILAALFSLLAVVDAFTLNAVVDMRHKSYDLMVRHRLSHPAPDPRIVIVDVDEASLAAMAKDYGRWPWPRQVLGEFLEQLQAQRPRAVVFDILFSDPDVFNPDSDAYFDAAVAASSNTWFPAVRLPAEHDARSALQPGRFPGARRLEGVADTPGTVAAVLPFFGAVLASGRVGTINVYPDTDGVVRSYRLGHDVHGWRLPSLPVRVAEGLGRPVPQRTEMLLNWRGGPFSYRHVGFAEVYLDMQRKERQRPADEFRDAIVVIGATAAGLGDIKPTSMDHEFPGVEVLATAIDNLLHDDWVRTPPSSLPNLLVALAILWGTALALRRDPDSERLNGLFGASQVALMGVSYAMINLSPYYLNLTGPVFLGVVYFSVARIYSSATARALERGAVALSVKAGHENGATLLLLQFGAGDDPVSASFLKNLRKVMEREAADAKVDVVRGRQFGTWGLVEGTVTVSWVYPLHDLDQRRRVDEAAGRLRESIPGWLERYGVGREVLTGAAVVSSGIGAAGSETTRSEWRRLLAAALAEANAAPPDPPA